MEQFHLPVSQHFAAFRQRSHKFRDTDLSGMMFQSVQYFRHEIIVRRNNLIDHDGAQCLPSKQPLGQHIVHGTDTRHHGCTVRNCKSLTDMHFQRFEPAFGHHLRCRTDFPAIRHFTLAYQCQCYMSQLHQVAAGTDAAMPRYNRTNSPVYKFYEKINERNVYS